MCLWLCINKSNQARRDRKYLAKHEGKRTWTVWKLLAWTREDGGIALTSPTQDDPWRPKVFVSSRGAKALTARENRDRCIHFGVHAFTTPLPDGHWFHCVCVPMRASRSAFVATGQNGEVVFTRLRLTKRDYDAAIRRIRKMKP